MAGLSTLVLLAVEHLGAGLGTGVAFSEGRSAVGTAWLVACVLSATQSLLTDSFTGERFLLFTPAFDLATGVTAVARLVDCHLTGAA